MARKKQTDRKPTCEKATRKKFGYFGELLVRKRHSIQLTHNKFSKKITELGSKWRPILALNLMDTAIMHRIWVWSAIERSVVQADEDYSMALLEDTNLGAIERNAIMSEDIQLVCRIRDERDERKSNTFSTKNKPCGWAIITHILIEH